VSFFTTAVAALVVEEEAMVVVAVVIKIPLFLSAALLRNCLFAAMNEVLQKTPLYTSYYVVLAITVLTNWRNYVHTKQAIQASLPSH
jgi:hypothetical protein